MIAKGVFVRMIPLALAALFLLLLPNPAAAATPWWQLSSGARPAHLPAEAGEEAELFVTAENLGDAPLQAGASKVTIADTLPPGLEAIDVAGIEPGLEADFLHPRPLGCSLATLSCTFDGTLAPYDSLEMRIKVIVKTGAHSGEENQAIASGGNAASETISRPLAFSGEPTPFGSEDLRVRYEEEGGAEDAQAGSHPFQFTTTVALNQGPDTGSFSEVQPHAEPVGLLKDSHVKFPPGFIGNPMTVPTCSLAQFLTTAEGKPNPEENKCPPQSAIGVASVTVFEPTLAGYITVTQPLFNLEPYAGEPARFGFYVTPILAPTPVILDTSLRSKPGEGALPGQSEDYGITVSAINVTQTASLVNARVTTWGTPGDPRHDNSRGWGCIYEAREVSKHSSCTTSEAQFPSAFLTMPTSCTGPMQASVEAAPWSAPTLFETFLATEPLPAMEGCNRLPFAPSIGAQPTAASAESASGLNFSLDINDEGLLNKDGLAQSELNKAVVTLPEGVTINPSVGEGLGACSPAQYSRESLSSQPGEGCPNSSKIGTLEVQTPVLDQTIHGDLFLAQQDDPTTTQHGAENPFDSLLAIYMVLRNAETGIFVKIPAKVEPDPRTGQLITTAENLPQLPFSHFRLHFREGQRAPLVTPPSCGTYTAKALLYPWARPDEPLTRTSSFQVTSGIGGGPCPPGGVPPFAPGYEAGSINNNAKSFSPFYMRLVRRDGEQDMTKFSSILPPGVLGKLARVSKCSDSAIAVAKAKTGRQELASPSCPASSQIGRTLTGVGVGGALTYVGGKVYLGGAYHGDPLSVIAITPGVAGPFDGGTVVVREALTLNPETAEVEVDGAASDPIPHILKGIVLKVREIRVYVDRDNFILNPTSCDPSSAKATLFGGFLDVFSSADDVPVNLSSRYQAANCSSLPFKPRLSLKLNGATRRGGHPSLKAVLEARPGDANIGKAVVTLPTSAFLDQAHIRTICTRVQYAANGGSGAGCPKAARYGYARAYTPLLDEPVEGPVYLRSSNHKLPDLVVALHGIVNVDIVGRIDSFKGGIRSNFETVPDAPVSKFILNMQGGKKGLVINSRNLCAGTNRGIANFTGQNGVPYNFKPVVKPNCHGKKRKQQRRHK